MRDLRIGTSGWMYKDWGAAFYPREMKNGHLAYLAGEFNTVEVNTSFYHLPLKSTFKKWHDETPEDFLFAVKLSRYITHKKRLESVREPLERFIKRAKGMQDKLGVVLVQLPPFLRYDGALLRTFLASLRAVTKRNSFSARFALEPRHRSWMENAAGVRAMLTSHNVALVFPHSAKIASFRPEEENLTANFVYVRFHGPSEFAASRYGARRLAPWAARIRKWRRTRDVFVYFNNDVHGHAIHDARTLNRLLAR